jgi:DNA-binding MarR family transcriptional regulator
MDEQTSSRLSVWGKGSGEASHLDFSSHVKAIAHGRFVLRRILRLLDEQAVAADLMPLEHQALLQVYAADSPLPVSRVADRLDIAPALASRLIRRLENGGLVERVREPGDKRIIAVKASAEGIERLRRIDNSVHGRVHAFQETLDHEGKMGALATFAFYLGLDSDPRLAMLFNDAGMATHGHGHVHDHVHE